MPPNILRDIDRILRAGVGGVMTSPPPLSRLILIIVGLGGCVGAGIGMFTIFRGGSADSIIATQTWMQPIASAIKIPALFLLTVATTIPSLYVFNTLLGPGHGPGTLARSIFRSLVVSLAVLASVVPIILFFSIVTSSYPFMKILVACFAGFAGLLGMRVILSELRGRKGETIATRMEGPDEETAVQATDSMINESHGSGGSLALFMLWCLLFGLVGSQMAWILRPFIGSPDTDFTWFRPAGGNLLIDLFQTIRGLVGG